MKSVNSTLFIFYIWKNIKGDNMKVKVFDEMHEKDLEKSVNDFLDELDDEDIVDIKYEVSISMVAEEQIYCFSAMIVYKS